MTGGCGMSTCKLAAAIQLWHVDLKPAVVCLVGSICDATCQDLVSTALSACLLLVAAWQSSVLTTGATLQAVPSACAVVVEASSSALPCAGLPQRTVWLQSLLFFIR